MAEKLDENSVIINQALPHFSLNFILAFFIFCGFSIICGDVSAVSGEWIKLLGTSSNDYGWSIAVDSNNNAYITGKTYGDLSGITNAGKSDIFIAKYNSAGNIQWTQLLGTSSDDYGECIAIDSNDNIYITGYTGGNLDGNSIAGAIDIFISKYDSDGNRKWTKLIGTLNKSLYSDPYAGIAVDSNNNCYIIGYVHGNLDGNTNAGGEDILIAKYDSAGNKQWTQLLGTAFNDAGTSIALDANNNIYITGYSFGSIDSNPNAGSRDVIIAKYDLDGNKIWTKLLGSSDTEIGRSIAVDSKSNVYVTGWTDGEPEGSVKTENMEGRCFFIAKYDTNGNRKWTKLIGSLGVDISEGIAIDSSDNIYITGILGWYLDYPINTEGYGIFVTKYDTFGSRQWVDCIWTPGSMGFGIDFGPNDSLYITGRTAYSLGSNINAGREDIFIWKLLDGNSPPAFIPTLSGWGMIILSLLMFVCAFIAIQRRQQA